MAKSILNLHKISVEEYTWSESLEEGRCTCRIRYN